MESEQAIRGFSKGRSSKIREGSRVRQTLEEGRRTYRPKRCEKNNKDEDNSPKTLNDKNQLASSKNMKLLNGARDWKVSVDLKTSLQFLVHII